MVPGITQSGASTFYSQRFIFVGCIRELALQVFEDILQAPDLQHKLLVSVVLKERVSTYYTVG
jgi:hypothetical protein